MTRGETWYQCYTPEGKVFGFAAKNGVITNHEDKRLVGDLLSIYKKVILNSHINVALIAKIED